MFSHSGSRPAEYLSLRSKSLAQLASPKETTPTPFCSQILPKIPPTTGSYRMLNRTQRQYFSKTIVEIETIAYINWNDCTLILALVIELFHRKTARAVALRTRLLERASELILQGFAWPSTDAEPSDNDTTVFIDAPGAGLLGYLGYRVGLAGLDSVERTNLLDTVYAYRLPQVNSVEYMNEWGEPNTGQRLQKMAESIAAFARNAKRRQKPPKQAILDWEADLEYLRKTYYVARYSFFWPNTVLYGW